MVILVWIARINFKLLVFGKNEKLRQNIFPKYKKGDGTK